MSHSIKTVCILRYSYLYTIPFCMLIFQCNSLSDVIAVMLFIIFRCGLCLIYPYHSNYFIAFCPFYIYKEHIVWQWVAIPKYYTDGMLTFRKAQCSDLHANSQTGNLTKSISKRESNRSGQQHHHHKAIVFVINLHEGTLVCIQWENLTPSKTHVTPWSMELLNPFPSYTADNPSTPFGPKLVIKGEQERPYRKSEMEIKFPRTFGHPDRNFTINNLLHV